MLDQALAIRHRIGAVDAERMTQLELADAYEDVRHWERAERSVIRVITLDARLGRHDPQVNQDRLRRVRQRLQRQQRPQDS